MEGRFSSDLGPFGIMPLWIVESGIGDKAIRLFAVLSAKYADRTSAEAFPSRRVLTAAICAKSERTTDAAIKELQDIGALTVSPRYSKDGDKTSNLYTLRYVGQSAAPPLAMGCATVGQPVAHQEPEVLEPESVPSTQPIGLTPYKKPGKFERSKQHRLHVYCADWFCVTAEKHAAFQRRIVLAGQNLEDYNLMAWYELRRQELETGEVTTTDHPALWLEKQFAEGLREAVAS